MSDPAAPSSSEAAPEANPKKQRKTSLRIKTLALFLTIGLIVPGVAAAFLLPKYGRVVRASEEHQQQLLLSRVRKELEGSSTDQRRALELFASAVEEASRLDQSSAGSGSALLRAALSSSDQLDVVRLVIPQARINTIIAKKGSDRSSVPEPTEQAIAEARAQGWSFSIRGGGKATITVKVPSSSGTEGYVVATQHLDQLRHKLSALLAENGLSESTLVVTTREGRVLTSHSGLQEVLPKPGDDALGLPAFEGYQAGLPADITYQFSASGKPMIASMGPASDLGWNIAMWRPLEVALADYRRVQSLALGLGFLLLIAILVIAFAASEAITRPVLFLSEQAKLIGRRDWGSIGNALGRKDELGELSRSVSQMAQDLRAGELEIADQTRKRANLSRFMSRPVVDRILSGEDALELGGHYGEVTVLFADMVAFTSASEDHSPEEMVSLLNELFSILTEVVFRHGGTVDKFIGDCLMAVWGAPEQQPDHGRRAVAAARDMMRFLEAASDEWYDKYKIEVRIAIGINSGEAIVGNIGSEKRMEYTVVGDVVNVASRLETIAAPNQVLMSQSTQNLLHEKFSTRLLGERALSGRSAKVGVYELEIL